jgi:hypothetical protein
MEPIREKVIIVADVLRDPSWSRRDVMVNLPDWVAIALGKHGAAEEQSRYWLDDPTVYVSLEDFDSDRKAGADHFAPAQLELWRPPLPEEAYL